MSGYRVPGDAKRKGLFCKDCRCWDNQGIYGNEKVAHGVCRRHGPTHLKKTGDYYSDGHGTWPLTYATDWCGEIRSINLGG